MLIRRLDVQDVLIRMYVKLLSFALIPKTDSVARSGTVVLRVSRLLKTRDRALPAQTCTLGYIGMSVHSA